MCNKNNKKDRDEFLRNVLEYYKTYNLTSNFPNINSNINNRSKNKFYRRTSKKKKLKKIVKQINKETFKSKNTIEDFIKSFLETFKSVDEFIEFQKRLISSSIIDIEIENFKNYNHNKNVDIKSKKENKELAQIKNEILNLTKDFLNNLNISNSLILERYKKELIEFLDKLLNHIEESFYKCSDETKCINKFKNNLSEVRQYYNYLKQTGFIDIDQFKKILLYLIK